MLRERDLDGQHLRVAELPLQDQVDHGSTTRTVVKRLDVQTRICEASEQGFHHHALPGFADHRMRGQHLRVGDTQQAVQQAAVTQVALGVLHELLGGRAVPGGDMAPQERVMGNVQPVADSRLAHAKSSCDVGVVEDVGLSALAHPGEYDTGEVGQQGLEMGLKVTRQRTCH